LVAFANLNVFPSIVFILKSGAGVPGFSNSFAYFVSASDGMNCALACIVASITKMAAHNNFCFITLLCLFFRLRSYAFFPKRAKNSAMFWRFRARSGWFSLRKHLFRMVKGSHVA